MVWVKICGITNPEDAAAAVEAGADALGFNFWRPGRRYLAPEAAAAIIATLPPQIAKVGVFVDEEPAEVLAIARQAGLTAVQLHGSEPPEYLDRLGPYQKLKAFRVDDRFCAETLGRYRADAFLLDAAGSTPGGTGARFDWRAAIAAKRFGRIILAGGLTAENVGEAVRQVAPWGVDVASGVECEPGRKDPRLLREFIRAVRQAEGRDGSG
jgi:phosphoribosylanthranilate isomerase